MNGQSFPWDGRRTDGFGIHQLSKSSPSQLPPFFFKRSSRQDNHQHHGSSPSNNNNKAPSLSHVPCKFFKQGTCTAGANCIFSHNPDSTSETAVCRYYLKGTCKFGTKCALLHTLAVVDSRKKGPSRPNFSSSTSPHYTNNNNNNNTRTPFQRMSTTTATATATTALLPMDKTDDYYYDEDVDDNYEDINDAMLPSSLNDLLTPSELQLKRAREQQDLLMEYSSLPLGRYPPLPPPPPSLSSSSYNWTSSMDEDTRTSSDHDLAFDFDDDVQFFMEVDPSPPTMDKKQLSTPFVFPSLNAHRS